MKRRSGKLLSFTAAIAMLVIISDTKTALSGAQEAVSMCLRTVIPSLFPFFVLSGIINSNILGVRILILRPLGKLCKIPRGAESLLLLGLIAGYPVGAKLITMCWRDRSLPDSTAKRMLGFCNNAGPAFLFGMVSPMFEKPIVPWVLWAIHISGAIITGWILPNSVSDSCNIQQGKPITLYQSLQAALKTTATVCGWVTIFRIIVAFCDRWFLWRFPVFLRVLFTGCLELANGCIMLKDVSNEAVRFLVAGIILASGGLCVGMQTVSVTECLGPGLYFPGKLIQTCLTTMISAPLIPILFPDENAFASPLPFLLIPLIAGFLMLIFLHRKKVVAIKGRMMYNMGS